MRALLRYLSLFCQVRQLRDAVEPNACYSERDKISGGQRPKKLDKGQGQLFSPRASQCIGMMATAEFQWILKC